MLIYNCERPVTPSVKTDLNYEAVIIGGGPAGLMAAEQLAAAGRRVAVFEQKPSVGRKFLRAGIGGLNITHSERHDIFCSRYANSATAIAPWLTAFGPDELVQWCHSLGIETFVGSSGRVFPTQMKAAPLLRRWLQRLRTSGVIVHTRHRWLGWDTNGDVLFEHAGDNRTVQTKATILAVGGASWAALGSDGSWAEILSTLGIACEPFKPSNCGFNSPWPTAFADALAGQALKNIGLQLTSGKYHRGDALASHYGVEGSLIYAASRDIRDTIAQQGNCTIYWDLLPDTPHTELRASLARRRRGDSASTLLRKLGIKGSKLTLLKALTRKADMQNPDALPSLLKKLPQQLNSCRPIDEAISTAGGIPLRALNDRLMLNDLPGVFCAGEMLDWDAPTGGYLLTACFASGLIAGRGAHDFLCNRT